MDPSFLTSLILQYRYPILVPAALLWGLLVCMVAGVLIRLGYLEFLPAYFCLMLGELIGDVIWYWLGYRFGESFVHNFGEYVGITERGVHAAKELFRKYDRHILLSTKLTTGFGFAIPILFTAGLSRVSFYRYVWANVSGQFFWTGGLVAVGYFFGDFYLRVNSVFEKAMVASLFLIVFLCLVGFTQYARRRYGKRVGFDD